MTSWPLLEDVARRHLASGAVVGRRVRIDVPSDEARDHVDALLVASGAEVVADPGSELVVAPWRVAVDGRWADVPVLDPTGEAHGTVRAVLRLTNRRLPGTRVAVVGFGPAERELAGAVRALGGRVVVVDEDPLHRLAAATAGFDVGGTGGAAVVLGAAPGVDVDAGTVLVGPAPAAVGEVVDEPRPGMLRVRRGGDEVVVLDPLVVGAGRAVPWLDLTWTTRLVTLAWLAAAPAGTELPVEVRRELAEAALVSRQVLR